MYNTGTKMHKPTSVKRLKTDPSLEAVEGLRCQIFPSTCPVISRSSI